jgi:hypothetical protein
MELLAAAVVVSAAYVYAPLLRVHAARRLRVELPAGAVSPGADPVAAPPVELTPTVEAWCAAESEPWAQDEARARARVLYAEHGDWNVVLHHLEQR